MAQGDEHPAVIAFDDLWYETIVRTLPPNVARKMKFTRSLCEAWFVAGAEWGHGNHRGAKGCSCVGRES